MLLLRPDYLPRGQRGSSCSRHTAVTRSVSDAVPKRPGCIGRTLALPAHTPYQQSCPCPARPGVIGHGTGHPRSANETRQCKLGCAVENSMPRPGEAAAASGGGARPASCSPGLSAFPLLREPPKAAPFRGAVTRVPGQAALL
ncbi:unnamed protein product [Rangifer tarandus platyrhynchus]|uniref:Uncharacterized protein n=1 Tax=Rangifer tarandus platyrhynchus TaxID=3082113 RepID=A0AC59ZHH4_RANTA